MNTPSAAQTRAKKAKQTSNPRSAEPPNRSLPMKLNGLIARQPSIQAHKQPIHTNNPLDTTAAATRSSAETQQPSIQRLPHAMCYHATCRLVSLRSVTSWFSEHSLLNASMSPMLNACIMLPSQALGLPSSMLRIGVASYSQKGGKASTTGAGGRQRFSKRKRRGRAQPLPRVIEKSCTWYIFFNLEHNHHHHTTTSAPAPAPQKNSSR